MKRKNLHIQIKDKIRNEDIRNMPKFKFIYYNCHSTITAAMYHDICVNL